MKNRHQEFGSDIFFTFVAAEAIVEVGSADGSRDWISLEQLQASNILMENKILLNIKLPPLPQETVYRSFKIIPRITNCPAIANAGLSIKVDAQNKHTVTGTPILAFGGIASDFVRATATEQSLVGKSLEDPMVLQDALNMLGTEVQPEVIPTGTSPEYRRTLCQSFLYRTILGIVSNVVGENFISGAEDLERPLSSGTQTFATTPDTFPVGEPVQKLEALVQGSGIAEYVNDMPERPGELHGAFVMSTKGDAALDNIDPAAALAMPGVVTFIGVDDITGTNNIAFPADFGPAELLFPETRVSYHGQPLGLIVATTEETARAAVDLVSVTYSDEKRPVLTIDEALTNPLPPGQPADRVFGDVDAGFGESTMIVEGTMHRDAQSHFQLETHITRVIPKEDCYDVYSATQWPAGTQFAISQILGLDANKVNVVVKRVGGAFGCKISRGNITATATALAAQKLRKPVRTNLDLSTNMQMIGWREPFQCHYKVGVDADGLLKAVEATISSDAGYNPLDNSAVDAMDSFPSCYKCDNWKFKGQMVLTNTASNTPCRTPGTVDGIAFMETIMDNIAEEMGMDPLEFRKKNIIPDGTDVGVFMQARNLKSRITTRDRSVRSPSKTILPQILINGMIAQMEEDAQVAARKAEIADFNSKNRWTKKGFALLPMLWPYRYPSTGGFSVIVSIYVSDGSVAVCHGGIEVGQGINTSVAQVAAYELGCPLEKISVKPTNSLTAANSLPNAGCLGSYSNIYCMKEACKKLRARLDKYAGNNWGEIIMAASIAGEDLTERYWNLGGEIKSHGVFGVSCSEVQLDVLTGKFIVTRTDLLEDAGYLTSPLMDIGQLEGGFVMGQGLFTSEKPIYDQETGQRSSNSTWHYFPPTALDVPVDFRIKFLENAPFAEGVYSSKVIAEPSVCLAFSIPMALRNAVASARKDAGVPGWFRMDCPLTVERLQSLCLVDPAQFVLN